MMNRVYVIVKSRSKTIGLLSFLTHGNEEGIISTGIIDLTMRYLF